MRVLVILYESYSIGYILEVEPYFDIVHMIHGHWVKYLCSIENQPHWMRVLFAYYNKDT